MRRLPEPVFAWLRTPLKMAAQVSFKNCGICGIARHAANISCDAAGCRKFPEICPDEKNSRAKRQAYKMPHYPGKTGWPQDAPIG